VTTLSLQSSSLEGKKIVLYEEGFLNWLKPEHGNYGQWSPGMYGMLPIYLKSLGATVLRSPQLFGADLSDANVLMLIFPDKPWKDGQMERIRQFVDRGGTLLVLGEHTILDTELLKLQDPELGSQLAALYEKLKPLQAGRTAATTQEAIDEIHSQEAELKRSFDEQEVIRRFREAGRKGPLNRFNEVLADTDMEVAFDSGTFAVGGWLQSYQALSHPTSAGIGDAANAFGVVIGASVDLHWPRNLRWPASPLLTGVWGWGDPGDPLNYGSFMARNDSATHEPRYDAGERLGDVVLAAEQRIGSGRVVVFGDTSSFTNGVNMGAHLYTSRLFAYLADPVGSPQDPARQLGGLLLAIALALALLVRTTDLRLALSAIVLATSLWACTEATHRAWEILPDGRGGTGGANNLAYIDESHLGKFSPESWREDGLMGLSLTLMRNDYLTLMLPELTRDRLLVADVDLGIQASKSAARARLLISVAPGREYTADERETIRDFVRAGGVFLCTAGYDDSGPSRRLLEEFGFYVGGRRWQWLDRGGAKKPIVHYKAGYGPANWDDAFGEPMPLGHFKSPYFQGNDYQAFVRFYAGWAIECDGPDQLVISSIEALGLPLIVLRRYGQGLVTVVGDTAFAQNRNLENKDGSPFEGMRENAVFWRWFLALVRDGMHEGQPWFPQKSDTVPEGAKP